MQEVDALTPHDPRRAPRAGQDVEERRRQGRTLVIPEHVPVDAFARNRSRHSARHAPSVSGSNVRSDIATPPRTSSRKYGSTCVCTRGSRKPK